MTVDPDVLIVPVPSYDAMVATAERIQRYYVAGGTTDCRFEPERPDWRARVRVYERVADGRERLAFDVIVEEAAP